MTLDILRLQKTVLRLFRHFGPRNESKESLLDPNLALKLYFLLSKNLKSEFKTPKYTCDT